MSGILPPIRASCQGQIGRGSPRSDVPLEPDQGKAQDSSPGGHDDLPFRHDAIHPYIMGICRDLRHDLTCEGDPDSHRPRRTGKKTVIVPAAVTEPMPLPVEGHGGDDDRIDLFRRNRPDEIRLRLPDSVMAALQLIEAFDPAGDQLPARRAAERDGDPLPLSPSPEDQIVGADLAPEAKVHHQRGRPADLIQFGQPLHDREASRGDLLPCHGVSHLQDPLPDIPFIGHLPLALPIASRPAHPSPPISTISFVRSRIRSRRAAAFSNSSSFAAAFISSFSFRIMTGSSFSEE